MTLLSNYKNIAIYLYLQIFVGMIQFLDSLFLKIVFPHASRSGTCKRTKHFSFSFKSFVVFFLTCNLVLKRQWYRLILSSHTDHVLILLRTSTMLYQGSCRILSIHNREILLKSSDSCAFEQYATKLFFMEFNFVTVDDFGALFYLERWRSENVKVLSWYRYVLSWIVSFSFFQNIES